MPATIIDISTKKKNTIPETLDGRTYMLDITKASRFQCGGFSVNTKNYIAKATAQTQIEPIKKALKEGILVDITDSDVVSKGLVVGETSTTPVEVNQSVGMAFIKRMKDGTRVLVVPKDDEERSKIEAQIKETGDFDLRVEEDNKCEISDITEEPVPNTKPKQEKKKRRIIIP